MIDLATGLSMQKMYRKRIYRKIDAGRLRVMNQ